MSTEAALVRRCLSGDGSAYRELVEGHYGVVYRLCRRLLGCCHDAEDVAQEVFVRVFRSLHRWDPRRALRPWILGIAVNRCRTWLGRRARRPQPLADWQQQADPRPAGTAEELRQCVADAVDVLRADYRTVFILFHEQGYSYEEIAAMLDRPVGTVKTWLHRARLEVLDALRDKGWVGRPAARAESPQAEGVG